MADGDDQYVSVDGFVAGLRVIGLAFQRKLSPTYWLFQDQHGELVTVADPSRLSGESQFELLEHYRTLY